MAGACLNNKTTAPEQQRSTAQRVFPPFLPHKKGDLALALALPDETKIPDTHTRHVPMHRTTTVM